LKAIAETPCATMQFDDRGEWSLATRLEQSCQQGGVAVTQILDILNVDLEFRTPGRCRCHMLSS
jgi:hypothetical protein